LTNLITPVPYSNPYAQPWKLPNFESRRVPLRWTYGGTFTVPASSTVNNNAILINGSADFEWREIAFYQATIPGGTAPIVGSISARFKDSHGKRLSADLLAIEELQGPIPVSQPCPRGTQITVDLANNSAVDYSVQVILKGNELFDPLGINRCMPGFDPEQYIPLYDFYSVPPEGWHDEPFDYFFSFDLEASERRLLSLPMEYDADFYWRGETATISGSGDITLKFSDAFQNSLSQNFVLRPNAFGVAPQTRVRYPEVCCPAYSVPTVEIIEQVGLDVDLNLTLRGVKRFKN
jgi:hypothetical protein